ncbi:lytic transglycosylase, partial [Streptomyces sp. NPDC079189]
MVAAGAAVMAGTVVSAPAASAATPAPSGGNVDTWIKQSLEILHKQGIPATYEGIHKNLMRESSGNPSAINNWDSNAMKGIPSKGLM